MLKKIVLLLSSNLFNSILLFLRTIVAARLLTLEDYGIAATFLLTVVVIELMSNIGLNQMIIQADDGDDLIFQSSLQAFHALRGALAAVAMFFLAGPIARFLGNDHIIWAYQLLALVPIMNGFLHFDIYRAQRMLLYRPMMITAVLPPLISVLAVWPLCAYFGDYRAMLYTILLQWLTRLACSHLTSLRPYRLTLNTAIMRRGLQFGWPLLLNGLMLLLVFQGERMIVGRELGMGLLAIFSMSMSLVQTPMGAITRAIHQFILPQLSAAKDDDPRFNGMALIMVQASILATACMALGIDLLGPPVVTHALGEKYLPVLDYLLLIGAVETLRTMRSGLSQIALARARTGNSAVSNLPRVVTICVMWWALTQGAGIPTVLGLAALGELAGFGVALTLAWKRAGVRLKPLWPCLSGAAVFLIVLVLVSPLTPVEMPDLVLVAAFALLMLSLGPLWRYLRDRKSVAYQ